MGPEFRAGLEELLALGEERRCAIMCAEAVWWRCHRRIITDYLLARGFDVFHIVAGEVPEPAKITPEAVHALGLDAAASGGKEARGTGYRGTYSSREGHVESLDLGGIRVADPEAIFWLPNTGHDGKPWDVNVGNSILKDFVVTLDTVGRHVLIEKP